MPTKFDSDPPHIPSGTRESAPIFIVANGRSGTTLMRNMLNAHPNIYIAEEICFHFWMNLFHGSFRRRLRRYFQTFSYAWLRQDPRIVLDALPDRPEWPDFPDVYRRILQCKAAQYGRKRFGEKGPLLVLVLDRLLRDYPDARIIHMVRDPRAVVHSHTTMPWSTDSLLAANYIVRTNMKKLSGYGDRVLPVKLEELVAQPEAVMRKVLTFVGEDWDDRVLHHADHLLADEGIPFPWLAEASRNAREKSVSWREALSPAWIRITEKYNRATLAAFGYAPLPLAQEPSRGQMRWAIVSDLPRLLLLALHSAWAFSRLAITPVSDSVRIQTLMHCTNPGAWKQHPDWNPVLPVPPSVSLSQNLLR